MKRATKQSQNDEIASIRLSSEDSFLDEAGIVPIGTPFGLAMTKKIPLTVFMRQPLIKCSIFIYEEVIPMAKTPSVLETKTLLKN